MAGNGFTLGQSRIEAVADLGPGVLDTVMVETAA
jgi:hypothetical protein